MDEIDKILELKINPGPKLTYLWLYRNKNVNDEIQITCSELSFYIEMNQRSCQRYIRFLEYRCFIKKTCQFAKSGLRSANLYKIHSVATAKTLLFKKKKKEFARNIDNM